MSALFKKRIRKVRSFGRLTNHNSKVERLKPHFSLSEWNSWKEFVSKFYKTNFLPNISPLFVKKGTDNRPFIQVKLLDQDIVVLLDSGAMKSVVGSHGLKILEIFNITINPSPCKHIFVADGKSQDVQGVVDLPISIGNDCKIISALVVPSLPHAFILGCDFARKFEISINFHNDSWDIHSSILHSNLSVLDHEVQTNALLQIFSLDSLNTEQRIEADKIIESFKSLSSENRLGRTDKIKLYIDTGDAKPFRKRPFPLSPYMADILNKELDDMLKLGVIEPSTSPWSSPVFLIKKSCGEYRFVFDGRPLNELTKHDSYPLPSIDRILSMLRNSNFISSIDMRKSFWQIPLDNSSKEKTAFSVIGRGLFHFVTMPFGLRNGAQTQQRLVDAIFGPQYEPHIFTYLDNIIICSPSFEEHLSLLSDVRNKLKEANLTLNWDKCEFFKTTVKFLGFIVGSNSLRTDPDKIECMVNYPRPQTTTEVKRFVGLCSWYRRFLKDFSTLISPINDLLKGRKKNQPISWTDDAESSFIKIKELLVSAPILCQPDFSKRFTIHCDASNTGLGSMLTQEIDGHERVIAYASRSLSRSERNYSCVERECLSVLFGIDKFRGYVEASRFTVVTDHYSLLWLNNMQNPTGKLARWACKLRAHNFDLVHRKGSNNIVPDFLSRTPETSSEIILVDILLDPVDNWYNSLKEKILASPDNYPQWKVENGFVFKFVPFKSPVKTCLPEWKYLVPKHQRNEIIKSCHDPATAGHFGIFKTLNRVKEAYYWPKMQNDVARYCKSCKICGAQKHGNSVQAGLMGKEKIVELPFQIIALDLIGPLPRSKRGYKWILVIADWFTKYTLLFPIRNSKAPTITKILEKDIFLVYGVPEIVIVDNGPQLSGNLFKDVCKKYEVPKLWYNAVYSPQCNFVERNNKTVGTTLRCYTKEHTDWDKDISKIQQAINTSKHEVTGFTPSFLNFGRHVPLSGKFYSFTNRELKDVEITPGNRESYAENLQGLKEVFISVRNRLHAAYEKNSKMYNLRKRDLEFFVGDMVWRRNKVQSSAANQFMSKLSAKYILSVVKKKHSRLVYDLINEDGSKAGKWHVKDLKPYNNVPQDSTDDLSEEED